MDALATKKVIIDTDPGIDDAMAILAAFNAPELNIIGLTTIFGNVPTELATLNALRLVELAGCPNVPVATGAQHGLVNGEKHRIADFVHGTDGFGNTYQDPPKGKAVEETAAQFIVKTVHANPGEVTIIALGPLTNLAQALMLDPDLGKKWHELVILGGAFFTNGNVNPSAEANMFGDPLAADIVMGSSEKIRVVGLDVTHKCAFSGEHLNRLEGRGRFGTFIAATSQFYLDYHRTAYSMDAIHLHDPTCLVAALQPELFTWRDGPIRVLSDGLAKGCTIMDAGHTTWVGGNPWTGRPRVQVAVAVDSVAVVNLLEDLTSR